jgi:P27 family predicted phage terminase small subunit
MTRPQPTALKILRGNPGKRPLPANEPKPAAVIPDAPDHLAGEALIEWKRIVPELATLGLLTGIDRAALAAYCTLYGRWVDAEREIQQNGLTEMTKTGWKQKSAALQISDKALEGMLRYIREFGLSPASRTKVSATAPVDSDDEFFG